MPSARRAIARRCAVALASGTLAFVAGQLALGLAVEHWLPEARDPLFAAKLERLHARRAEAPDRPLVLVLGSSRVQMGLRAGALDVDLAGRPALVFNFGVPGAASLVEAVYLRRLLADGIRPDLVVLEVLSPMLNQPPGEPVPLEETWLNAARLRDSERSRMRLYTNDPQRWLRQWLKARTLPCVWNQANLRRLLGVDAGDQLARAEGLIGMDPYGWLPCGSDEVSPADRRARAEGARRQYSNTRGQFRLAAGPARALADDLALCRRQGIPVALLLMPEGPYFRDQYTPSVRAGIDAHVRGLGERWDVPIIDARDWFGDDAFWDSHHLLPRGAAAFTERFGREGLGPLLRGLPRR